MNNVGDQLSQIAENFKQFMNNAIHSLKRSLQAISKRIADQIKKWQNKAKQKPIRRVDVIEQPDETDNITRLIEQYKKKHYRPIRRMTRQRVYRLAGYTTVSKVNSRKNSEKRQRFLRQLLFFLIIILVILMLFYKYNPFRDLSEWYRIIGARDFKDLTTTSSEIATTTTTTPSDITSSSQAEGID